MINQLASPLAAAIKAGAIGVMPTDTVYGVVASMQFPNAIQRIYEVKQRPLHKPFVIIIGDISQLEQLGITLTADQQKTANTLWPAPVSLVLDTISDQEYLHRGTNRLAVRLPDAQWLRDIALHAGPFIATSANLSGKPIPESMTMMKRQLPDLDFYVVGAQQAQASQILRLNHDGTTEIIRD